MDTTYFPLVKNSLSFFQEHAWDDSLGVFYSELDVNGVTLSDKVHLVALSRLVYALSISSEYQASYLEKARKAADFILTKMVARDEVGPYFIESIDIKQGVVPSKKLGIWQQSYGLCGLAALYKVEKSDQLLEKIHELFDAYYLRFHDVQHGGFCGEYSLESGQVKDSKNLQALLYPVSAALAYLWEADSSYHQNYERVMEEHMDLLFDRGWNEEEGWVQLNFKEDWTIPQEDGVRKVTPGHNFQLGWNLIRASSWPFLSEEKRQSYANLGISILETSMQKPIFDGDVSGGFFREMDARSNSVVDQRKSWWQHAEAIIALSFLPDKSKERDQLFAFFAQNFVDWKSGGEFFFLDQDNQPDVEELKGSMGKSSYHITEMVSFLLFNVK
ncbi:MAG: AGE family epimerase/isomerase [Bacteroidota bacterium]